MAKRIFLIDDEQDYTELTQALFQFNGMEAEVSNDPLEAVGRLEKETFDALIVDLMMPGMSGLTLVARARAMPAYANAPIFVLSAKYLEDAERKELEAQKVSFITKPFEPKRLIQLVKEALGL